MRLSQIQKCAKCGEGLLKCGLPITVRFEVQSEKFDEDNIRRAHGMEQMMGGNVAIARVMGPDYELSSPNADPVKGYLCMQCAMVVTVAELAVMAYAPEQEEH